MTAAENATVVGGLYRVSGTKPVAVEIQNALVRKLLGAKASVPPPAVTVKAPVRAAWKRTLAFRNPRRLVAGYYVFVVVLRAETTGARQSGFVSAPFELRK